MVTAYSFIFFYLFINHVSRFLVLIQYISIYIMSYLLIISMNSLVTSLSPSFMPDVILCLGLDAPGWKAARLTKSHSFTSSSLLGAHFCRLNSTPDETIERMNERPRMTWNELSKEIQFYTTLWTLRIRRKNGYKWITLTQMAHGDADSVVVQAWQW